MARTEAVRAGSLFYCHPLSDPRDSDIRDIALFTPVSSKGRGVIEYLQRQALADEDANLMRTYLVRDKDSDELAGFFSLKAGLVSLDEARTGDVAEFDTVPGIELANFAVNKAYRDRHPAARGCGKVMFGELVLPLVLDASHRIGAAILYIFSLPEPKVMQNYATYGFVRLPPDEEQLLHARLKPRYDSQCVFMYVVL